MLKKNFLKQLYKIKKIMETEQCMTKGVNHHNRISAQKIFSDNKCETFVEVTRPNSIMPPMLFLDTECVEHNTLSYRDDIKWRRMPEPFDRHWVSSDGKVWDSIEQKLLKNYPTGGNEKKRYFKVKLFDNYRIKKKEHGYFMYVHRLVASCFLGMEFNAGKKIIVHHKDGNQLNNNVNNLDVLTTEEHVKIRKVRSKVLNRKSPWSNDEIQLARDLHQSGVETSRIASILNRSYLTTYNVVNEKSFYGARYLDWSNKSENIMNNERRQQLIEKYVLL